MSIDLSFNGVSISFSPESMLSEESGGKISVSVDGKLTVVVRAEAVPQKGADGKMYPCVEFEEAPLE